MWLEFHDMCRSFGSFQGTLMWPPMLKFEFPSKEIWINVKEGYVSYLDCNSMKCLIFLIWIRTL